MLASLAEALAHAGRVPDYLICGLAPADGLLSPAQRVVLLDGIARGMHVINGLHEFLNDDAEFVAAALLADVTITDVRRPKDKKDLKLFSGRIFDVTCPRIAVLGTDGAVGKRTTATLLVKALNDRGVKAVMVGTGQTTIMQGGKYGVALDALVPQFCSGEVENQVVAAFEGEDPDVIVVEGQGALSHPAYLTSAHILRGSRPAGVIVQHAPERRVLGDFPMIAMPTVAREVALIESFADTRVIGITVNHEGMADDAAIGAAIDAIELDLGLPATDPLTRPARAAGRHGPRRLPRAQEVARPERSMTAPRVEVDLDAIEGNTRVLVDRLAARGIRVTAVTKAALGSPAVAAAMLRGGATGLGDSRVENLARLDAAGLVAPRTLIRSPMISQVDAVVRHASTSLNTETSVLEALSLASSRLGTTHAVVLMVELGDLREGVLPADLVPLAQRRRRPARPDPGRRRRPTSPASTASSPTRPRWTSSPRLATDVEAATGVDALGGLRRQLGQPGLGVGDDGPRPRRRAAARRGDPPRPGPAHPASGPRAAHGRRHRRRRADRATDQARPALGRARPGRLRHATRSPACWLGEPGRAGARPAGRRPGRPRPPAGVAVLGMSSDHLVVDLGDHAAGVGDELAFGVGYGGLLRAMTSPFVAIVERQATRV